VVIGGLIASTLVTLVFIPVVYVTSENLLSKIKAKSWMPSWIAGEKVKTAKA
jgi:HAE1 family hydrophobic/amphiphilic exporter-1